MTRETTTNCTVNTSQDPGAKREYPKSRSKELSSPLSPSPVSLERALSSSTAAFAAPRHRRPHRRRRHATSRPPSLPRNSSNIQRRRAASPPPPPAAAAPRHRPSPGSEPAWGGDPSALGSVFSSVGWSCSIYSPRIQILK